MASYYTLSNYDKYLARINKVQDYIDENLTNSFTLAELAHESGFSKYHFHRVFSAIVNETLHQYITRIRLEKAASNLQNSHHKSITDIVYECGFTDSAGFARLFKKHFGMSATEYRRSNSNNSQAKSNNDKDSKKTSGYSSYTNNIRRDKPMSIEGKVSVENTEKMRVVYVRHTGPYQGLSSVFQKLITKLMKWAYARNLVKEGQSKLLTIYHDDPNITDEKNQKISVCLSVDRDVEVSGEVSKMTIPAGEYAIGHYEISASEYGQAWDHLYKKWLPDSGYQPGDGFSFELYKNDPNTHPQKKHIVDIYLPVKPL